MPVKGGTKCIKYLLFGFNFIFWVSERNCRALLSGATCPPRAPGPRLRLPVTGIACAGEDSWPEERALRPPAGSSAGAETGWEGALVRGWSEAGRAGGSGP